MPDPAGGSFRAVDLDALHDAARATLPPAAYTYFAAGSGTGSSRREAAQAWDRWRLRPRVLFDVSATDPATVVAGTPVAAPVLVAPTAYLGLAHPGGAPAMVAGAAAAGTLAVVSTRCGVPLDQVAPDGQPWWFQVYLTRDRGLIRQVVEAAAGHGARALVLTADAPYVARTAYGLDAALGIDDDLALPPFPAGTSREATRQAPDVTLDDLEWLCGLTPLPVLVKGVLRGDDAVRCLGAGAAGVVVSNHGGRQLDGAVAAPDVLPEVVDAVAGQGEVLVDGGVRGGPDVARALALGARAVLVGRPAIWALATGGSAAVTDLLTGYAADTRLALALLGAGSVAELDRGLLRRSG